MDSFLAWMQGFLLGDAIVLMVIMLLVIGLFELIFPATKIPARHYAFNFSYGFLTALINAITAPLIGTMLAFVIQKFGPGLINLSAFGLSGVSGALVAILVSSVIFDFFAYWQHRLEHASPVLWQEHLIHHSDEYMNVTSAGRQHFLDTFLLPIFVTIPMAVLFKLPPVEIGGLSLVPIVWIYFVHANLNIGFGPLWWLLVSPNYHRIHHSLERQHIDRNFCNWFPIWDILFGTAVRPRANECPATGVDGVTLKSVPQGILFPFQSWLKMIRARLTRVAD
jgi:sterol desaturase/sphingolipid hydroxylase (fatty acid hydroxylase superfamily)